MTNDSSDRQHITARIKDVGGIGVSRVLPVKNRRLIGAWCFLDHAGPALFQHSDEGMHVGPHPHIGLQTFTWMLKGEVLHRDSLGYQQVIRPGQVNLMTAGRGIAHSEDTASDQHQLHAAQLWIALPDAVRHMPARFDHYPSLPQWQLEEMSFTLLVGEYAGYRAPTLHFSPLVGVDIQARQAVTQTLKLQSDFEYGIFVLQGEAEVDGQPLGVNELLYLGLGLTTLELTLKAGAQMLLLGGEPLNEPVVMWWNFVARDKTEIQQVIREWNAGGERFGSVAGDSRPPTPSPLMP
ncbi:putative quercetin 2,3-dioxygenase [Salmonella enterica subsp. enterica serovar Choleraesuis]|nr:putative quercetin 2,3-dioxygenase [Salmonella enterica subsp. enterica serovar Choleraesuis]